MWLHHMLRSIYALQRSRFKAWEEAAAGPSASSLPRFSWREVPCSPARCSWSCGSYGAPCCCGRINGTAVRSPLEGLACVPRQAVYDAHSERSNLAEPGKRIYTWKRITPLPSSPVNIHALMITIGARKRWDKSDLKQKEKCFLVFFIKYIPYVYNPAIIIVIIMFLNMLPFYCVKKTLPSQWRFLYPCYRWEHRVPER